MTDPYGPGPAMPWPTDPATKARERLKTLGIVQMAFGGLGIMGLAYSYLARYMAVEPVGRRVQELMWAGDAGVYMTASFSVGVAMSVFLIFTGRAVSARKPVGRALTFAHATVAIVIGIAGQYANFAILYPVLDKFAETGGPIARAAAMGGFIGGLAGAVFGLAFPVIELWLITRPGTLEAFGMRIDLRGRLGATTETTPQGPTATP